MIVDVLMLADGRYLADPTPHDCPVCGVDITGIEPPEKTDWAEQRWLLQGATTWPPPRPPWVLQPCGHGLDYFEMRVRHLNADESTQEVRRRFGALDTGTP